MNGKIVSIHLTVIVSKAPYVVIDAPNVFTMCICVLYESKRRVKSMELTDAKNVEER